MGLVISNLSEVPGCLKEVIKTELFIKIGLVLLGAEILFPTIVKGGLVSVAQSICAVLVTCYFCYYIATKAGLSRPSRVSWPPPYPSAASRRPSPQARAQSKCRAPKIDERTPCLRSPGLRQ